MSKVANRTPTKSDNRGSGDHRRDSGRGDKSHSRSDSSSRSVKPEKDNHNDSKNNEETNADKSGDSKGEKKFTGRCRLFVGNLTPDVTEDDFKKMFEPYGEVSEVFVNAGRSFGFIRLDYRQNAEAAKAALDGLQRKGRILRVRFATHGAALRVKNLHPYVSNELLEQSFSQFGELERAIVIVDDRGKATGEGLVEFVRKPGAQQALRRINEGVFLIGSNPKPIEVEPLEQKDEEDGMPEKFLPRNEQYKKEREKEPRFAPHGSFEYDFGMRWKQLAEMERKGIEQVKKEMDENRLKLEDDMQNALYEYQAEQIRQDLLRQQEELRRLEELRNQDRMRRAQEIEMRAHHRRQEEERSRAVDERRRQEMLIRQQEMSRRGGGPGPGGPMDAPMRREELMGSMRGEGPGFQGGMQMRGAEPGMGMRGGSGGAGGASAEPGMRGSRGGAPPMQPPPAPPAGMGLERGGPAGQPGMARMPGGGGASGGGAGGFAGQPGMGAGSGGAGAANAGPGMGGSPNINNMGPGGMAGPGGPAAQMDFHAPVTEDLRNKGFECQQWVADTLPTSSGVDEGVWLTPTEHRRPDDALGPQGELDGRVADESEEKWDEFLSPNMADRASSHSPSLSSTSTSAALRSRSLDDGDSSHIPSHSPSLLAASSLDRTGNNHHHQDQQGQLCPHQQHRQPPPEPHLHPAQRMAEATVTSAGQRVMVNHLLRQHYIAAPYMVPPLVRVRRVPGPPVRIRMRWSRRMMMAQESYVDQA